MHSKQIRKCCLLDLLDGLLDYLDTTLTRAPVTQLELCKLWTHLLLDHAPDCLDRFLQQAAVCGDESDLGESLHPKTPKRQKSKTGTSMFYFLCSEAPWDRPMVPQVVVATRPAG